MQGYGLLYPLYEIEMPLIHEILIKSHTQIPQNTVTISLNESQCTKKEIQLDKIEEFIKELKSVWNYPSDIINYPLRNLCHKSIVLYNNALKNGNPSVVVGNHCCTDINCPQVHVMRLLLKIFDKKL